MTLAVDSLTNAERFSVARELVSASGVGDPKHARLSRDIDHAFFVACNSPTFRQIVGEIPQPKGSQIVVYVAGPMSGITAHNVPAFDAARDALQAEGFATITPPDITRSLGRHIPGIDPSGAISEEAYRELVKLDIREMIGASLLAFLPGWRNSRGARVEYILGEHMGVELWTVAGLLRAVRLGRIGVGKPVDLERRAPDLGPGHAIISVLTRE